jgi:hypothetical protein
MKRSAQQRKLIDMSVRPYTGNKDAVHAAKREGTKAFVDYCCFLFGVKNIGIFNDRNMVGTTPPKKSVHATWRATDLQGTAEQRIKLITFLFDHRDALGIEEIHDYAGTYKVNPLGWGAGYRCDRDAWRVYDKNTIGSKGANWVHVEIAPAMADDVNAVHAAFKTIFG